MWRCEWRLRFGLCAWISSFLQKMDIAQHAMYQFQLTFPPSHHLTISPPSPPLFFPLTALLSWVSPPCFNLDVNAFHIQWRVGGSRDAWVPHDGLSVPPHFRSKVGDKCRVICDLLQCFTCLCMLLLGVSIVCYRHHEKLPTLKSYYWFNFVNT